MIDYHYIDFKTAKATNIMKNPREQDTDANDGLEPLFNLEELLSSKKLKPAKDSVNDYLDRPAQLSPQEQLKLLRQKLLQAFNINKGETEFAYSLKDLATVCAGSLIANSAFEGGNAQQELDLLLQHLTHMIPPAVVRELEYLRLQTHHTFETSEDFFNQCKIFADKLKTTGICTMLGGYTGSSHGSSGHLVVLEVICEKQSDFGKIRIYNEGDGANNHHGHLHNAKQRYSAYFEKNDIPRWLLEHPLLYFALLLPRHNKLQRGRKWQMQPIYDLLVYIIPGTISESKILIKPPIEGTCFRDSIVAYLKSNIKDEHQFNQLNMARKMVSLLGFERCLNSQLNIEQIMFLQEIINKIKSSNQTNLLVHSYPETVGKLFNAYLDGVKTRIATINRELAKPIKANQNVTAAPNKPVEVNPTNITTDITDVPIIDGIAPKFITTFSQLNSSADLPTFLQKVFSKCHKYVYSYRALDATYILTQGLAQISTQSITSRFWQDAFTAEIAGQIIDVIYEHIPLFNILHLYQSQNNEFQVMTFLCIEFLWNIVISCSKKMHKVDISKSRTKVHFNHVPSVALPLLTNYLNTKEALKPVKTPRIIIGSDDFQRNIFRKLTIQHFDIAETMATLLAKDGKDNPTRTQNWDKGKYIYELRSLVANEPSLNQFKKIWQLMICLNYNQNTADIVNANCSLHEGTYPGSSDALTIDFPEYQSLHKPEDYNFIDSPYSLAHPLHQAPTLSKKNCADAYYILDKILENPDILISHCDKFLAKLTYTIDNLDKYHRFGTDAISFTLMTPELGNIWLRKMEVALDHVAELRNTYNWPLRLQSALRLCALINLRICQLSLAIAPIVLNNIDERDYEKLSENFALPIIALHALCCKTLTPNMALAALCATAKLGYTSELQEGLHHRVYREQKTSISQWLNNNPPQLNVALPEDVVAHQSQPWQKLGKSRRQLGNFTVNLQTGITTINNRILALPHCVRQTKAYQAATAYKKNSTFSPLYTLPNAWISHDQQIKILVKNNNFLVFATGKALLAGYEHAENMQWLDKSKIALDHYYVYDESQNYIKTLTGTFPEKLFFQLPLPFRKKESIYWTREDQQQTLILLNSDPHLYVYENLQNGKRAIFNPEIGLYSGNPLQSRLLQINQATTILPSFPLSYYYITWLQKDGTIEKISIPILNLNFKVEQFNNEIQLVSQEFPGFCINSKTRLNELLDLPAILLVDSQGNHKIVSYLLSEDNSSDMILKYKWHDSLDSPEKAFVLERSNPKLQPGNSPLKYLFNGSSVGIVLLVRSLLRSRLYDLAKGYVDLLSLRNFTPNEVKMITNLQYLNSLKLEHPQATLLIIRLHLMVHGSCNSHLYYKYVRSYNSLPIGWALSKEEESHFTDESTWIKQHKARLRNQNLLTTNLRSPYQDAKLKPNTNTFNDHNGYYQLKGEMRFANKLVTALLDQQENLLNYDCLRDACILGLGLYLHNKSHREALFFDAIQYLYLSCTQKEHNISEVVLWDTEKWTLLQFQQALIDQADHAILSFAKGEYRVITERAELCSLNTAASLESYLQFRHENYKLALEKNQMPHFKTNEIRTGRNTKRIKLDTPAETKLTLRQKLALTGNGQRFENSVAECLAIMTTRLSNIANHDIAQQPITHVGERRERDEPQEESSNTYLKRHHAEIVSRVAPNSPQLVPHLHGIVNLLCVPTKQMTWNDKQDAIHLLLSNLQQAVTEPIAKRKIAQLILHTQQPYAALTEYQFDPSKSCGLIESDLSMQLILVTNRISMLKSKIRQQLNHPTATGLNHEKLHSVNSLVQLTELEAFRCLAQINNELISSSPSVTNLLNDLVGLSQLAVAQAALAHALQSVRDGNFAAAARAFSECYIPNDIDSVSRKQIAAFQWLHQLSFRQMQAWLVPQLFHNQEGFTIQAPTGFGKTKFLTQLLAHQHAFMVGLVPPGQVSTYTKDMQTLAQNTHSRVFRFTSTKNAVNTQKFRLTERTQPLFVTSTASDLLSLVLNFYDSILMLYGIHKSKVRRFEWVPTYCNLVEELQAAHLVIDEPQLLFTGSREYAHSRKTEVGIPYWRGELTAVLYQILVKHDYLRYNNKAPVHLTDQDRLLIAEDLCKHPLLNIPQDNIQNVVAFLINAPTYKKAEAEAIYQCLTETYGAEKYRLLRLARAQIRFYFKFCLAQRCDVDYGFKAGALEARPYDAKDRPSPGNSIYDIIESLINFTMQAYIIHGLTKDQVIALFQSWANLGSKSADNALNRCLNRYSPFQNTSLAAFPLMSRPQQQALIQEVSQSPMAAIAFTLLKVLPKVEYCKSKTRVTGASISTLIRSSTTLSATPNTFHFPKHLREGHLDHNTDLNALYRLTDPEHTTLVKLETLDATQLAAKPNISAIVDPYPALYDKSNEDIAKQIMLGAHPTIERVAFYDSQQHAWFTVDRQGHRYELTTQYKADPSLVYFIDQERAGSTDLKLFATGIIRVIVDANMTYTALHQAAGRAREWGIGQQHVELLLTPKFCHDLPAITHMHTVMQCYQNDGRHLQREVVTIHKDLMTEVCRRALQPKLLELKKNPSDSKAIIALISPYKHLIKEKVDRDGFMQLGLTPPASDREVIDEHYQKLIRQYGNSLLSTDDIAQLKWYLDSCKSLLPENSHYNFESGFALTAETESDTEVVAVKRLEHDLNHEPHSTAWYPEVEFKTSFWQKFLEQDFKNLKQSEYTFDTLMLQSLNNVLCTNLFTNNMFMTKGFLSLYSISNEKGQRLRQVTDYPIQDQPHFYYRLPKVKVMLRVTPKDKPNNTFFIFISNKQEANILMQWMREQLESNRSRVKKAFTPRLLMLSGNTVASIDGSDEDSNEIAQRTLEARALACCYNGYCDDEELLSILQNMIKKQPKMQAHLQEYLTQRLGNVTTDEPTHLLNSKLGRLLGIEQYHAPRMV